MGYQIKLSPYANIFYVEWLLDKKSRRYNMVMDQKLYGVFNPERLSIALKKYILDHVVLNSHVYSENEEYYWVANDRVHELEYIEHACSDSELLYYISEGFDLSSGPLYRFRLIRLNDMEYRFITVFHHIIIDGSSVDKGLFKTLSHYYNQDDYTPQYSFKEQIKRMEHFTSVLYDKLQIEKEAHKIFWQQQLTDVEAIDLSFLKSIKNDINIGLHNNSPIGEQRFKFTQAELYQIKQLKRKYKITPYIYGQCIFSTLVYRYTNQKKIVLSYPVAIKEGIDFIYGAQVNTNLIAYEFNENTTIHDLFEQGRRFFNSLKENNTNHAYYPVINILQDKSEGNKRLFDVSFVQTNFKDQTYQFNGITNIEVLDEFNIDLVSPLLNTDWASYLFFEQEVRDDQFNYRVRYDTNLIDEALLNKFIDSYKKLFLSVLSDLTCEHDIKSILTYDIFPPGQYYQTMYEWNRTEKKYSDNKTIHQLFEEQAEKTPYHIATIFNDTEYTYQEINQQANQLAGYIRKTWNIKPDELIAICLERSHYMLISILAILKSGGAYVPLDIAYPDERILYILDDTKTRLILTDKAIYNRLKVLLERSIKENTDIICIDDKRLQGKLDAYTIYNLAPSATNSHLAYIIYTSGTTGKPKGVMIEHKGIVNRIQWMNGIYPLTEKDRVLQKTPYVFDVSVWELFWANWYGACIVFARPEGHKDPDYIIDIINRHQITVIHFVPSMLNIFGNILENSAKQNSLPSLKYLFCSGEVLSIETVQNIHKLLPHIEVYNLYGPTEASVDVLYFHCDRQQTNSIVYIGKPIDNTVVYLLDHHKLPLPVGAVGELYLGGIGLARGYLNRPELNAEKFILNPFCSKTEYGVPVSKRLYKTGDKARWLSDGNIEYIGRTDQQVKVRGYRIELAEIETILNHHPKVKQSAVLVKERKNSFDHHLYLIAYYTSSALPKSENINNHVMAWQALYQETYKSLTLGTIDNDFTGWNDSYSGRPIPQREMEEWLKDTIDKIQNLNPVNILEIGSGSGLILFNIIQKCHFFYASDFSITAIDYLQRKVEADGLKDKVILFNARADNIPYNEITAVPVDTVIINSVIQYFPDIDYFEKLIINLASHIDKLSKVFIGDIRNYDLLDLFYYSVLCYKNTAITKKEIELYKQRDKELLFSPCYFLYLAHSIPEIDYIEVLAKECNTPNELSKFRYDVILHFIQQSNNVHVLYYRQFKLEEDIEHYLHNQQHAEYLTIKYPNKNIYHDYITYQTCIGCNLALTPPVKQILSMSEITQTALKNSFKTIFYIDIYNGVYLNIVFYKINSSIYKFKIKYEDQHDHRKLNNNPAEAVTLQDPDLSDEIRYYLGEKLPSYMIPDMLVCIKEFPLTVNGKLDKDALPEPDLTIVEDYVTPRNELESSICFAYAEILRLPANKVGIYHDFFKLGGNSLLSIRLATRLQKNLKIEIADIFKLRTPYEIAANSLYIEDNLRKKLNHIKSNHADSQHPLVIDDLSTVELGQQVKYKKYLLASQQNKFDENYKNIRAVLLTGATGHLGCNILHQLLVETDYTIYLPIRASDDRMAYARISKKFQYYFDKDLKKYVDRVNVFNADLELPHFNISAAYYQRLVNNVDSIIHAAALVKHYGNYDEFYRANVQTTIHLLELSKLTVGKDFHYISTGYTLLNGHVNSSAYCIFDESDNGDILLNRDNVYAQTKYEGERVTREYRQYGITSNIYRLGNLAMHSGNFRHQENLEENAFFVCMNNFFTMGMITKEMAKVEISPVDQSALAIIKIFDQLELSNANYHLFNPNLCNLLELFSLDEKWALEEVDIEIFILKLLEKLDKGIDNKQIELFMLHQSWLKEHENKQMTEIKIAQDRTIAALAKLGFYWPKITKNMFDGILSNINISTRDSIISV